VVLTGAAVFAQAAVGIFTVLNGAPPGLALLHQGGALLVVFVLVRARFAAAYPPEQRIER
jgi:cytochrome c oxidase assembly protein subunit 15